MEPKFNPYNTKGRVIFGRIRKFFLGKETPSIFSRISCNIALLYFLYIFLWSVAIFIAFNFGQNLPKAKNWNELFQAIGTKYNIADIQFSFTLYLISLLTFSLILFVGVLLVWRRKLRGYLMVIFSAMFCTGISLILLGIEYVKNEATWFEFGFGAIVIAFFTIDYFLKRRIV